MLQAAGSKGLCDHKCSADTPGLTAANTTLVQILNMSYASASRDATRGAVQVAHLQHHHAQQQQAVKPGVCGGGLPPIGSCSGGNHAMILRVQASQSGQQPCGSSASVWA
jgi:hypothetical protein